MDIDTITERLRARRTALAAEFDRMTAPPEAGATVGFGKRIGDGTTEAVERITSTATARSLAASMKDIDRALAKIADGTYGLCDRCGDPIPEARLLALPDTGLCMTCKSAG